MESKSNYYHFKNEENNWNLIKQIIKNYSVSHLERGCFLSDCIGSTYDIEDIYNNMKALLLVYNSDYNNVKNQSNKKRKVSSSNNTNNSIESDFKESDNMFNAYHELPDFMFRKNTLSISFKPLNYHQ